MELLHPSNLVAWALQAAVVVLVAAPLPRLLGMWSPRARMTYWRVVLVACLLLPLLQTWVVREVVPNVLGPTLSADVVAATGAPAWPVSSFTETVSARASRPFLGPIGAAEVLIAGVLLRLAWLGLGVFTVGRLRRSARPMWPRPPSVDRAATLAETDAEFLVSATASRPVTCGWAWPVVLVPRTFETFPEHEQTAIATHELLHVSRADWARNAADEVLRALLWFHPGVWYVINQIQLAREQVVDREAVRRLGTRQPYLEALLRLARPAPRLVLTPASLFLKRAHLRQRVTLLVKEASMSRVRIVGSLAVMAVVIFIGGRMATAAFPLQQSGAKTPGVATAAPQLHTTPMTFSSTRRASRSARPSRSGPRRWVSRCTFEPGIEQALNTSVGPIAVQNTDATLALSQILGRARLGFRVVGDKAIVVGLPQPGSGGLAGAPRPGMSTGNAAGGNVAGGVVGGVGGGVGGGVAGGIGGGVAGGTAAGRTSGFDTAGFFASSLGGGTTNVTTRALPSVGDATGTAKVFVTIDSSGHVSRIGFVSVTTSDLVAAAVEAAKQWVFEPSDLPERETVIAFNFGAASGNQDTPTVRIGGSVAPPKKVHDVKPIYPKEAVEARIQGVQILEITIDPAGNVIGARALRGQRVLVGPAIDAVLQWKFTPWDGPERRLMTVTVNFTLADGPGPGLPVRDAPAGGAGMVSPTPASWPADATRVGGNIKPPNRLVDAKPVYPKEAQDARVQGVVIFELLVGPDGKVKDTRVLRSIPMLDKAAEEAVRQWEFTPTLLNGNAISIIMTVTVNFTLQ